MSTAAREKDKAIQQEVTRPIYERKRLYFYIFCH